MAHLTLRADEYGAGFMGRRQEENPFSPFCRAAFRRLCGTCAHFGGELRQEAPAACASLKVEVMAYYSAKDCDRWTRKVAEVSK